MKLPNVERAVIAQDKLKLVEYILNTEHKRGGPKARLLAEFGYRRENWQILERDIRIHHLAKEVDVIRRTEYGMRYEIHAPLQTPNGRLLLIRTIWQIDEGTSIPRLITLIPD